jgi:hypothetical protein
MAAAIASSPTPLIKCTLAEYIQCWYTSLSQIRNTSGAPTHAHSVATLMPNVLAAFNHLLRQRQQQPSTSKISDAEMHLTSEIHQSVTLLVAHESGTSDVMQPIQDQVSRILRMDGPFTTCRDLRSMQLAKTIEIVLMGVQSLVIASVFHTIASGKDSDVWSQIAPDMMPVIDTGVEALSRAFQTSVLIYNPFYDKRDSTVDDELD